MVQITWNPWHGCHRCSEGCLNCYMFESDQKYELNPEEVRIVKSKFRLPLMRDNDGNYIIQSGSHVGTCLTSDFFLEEADIWRNEAWEMIKYRKDCIFYIITKRPERVLASLPNDWGSDYDHVTLSVTVENQRLADKRIPILLDLPFKLKTLTIAPILSDIDLSPYLATGQIAGVRVGGEYCEDVHKARENRYEWYVHLYEDCKKYKVDFSVISLGYNFIKDGKRYCIPTKKSYEQAHKMGLELNFNHIYK